MQMNRKVSTSPAALIPSQHRVATSRDNLNFIFGITKYIDS
jgi:hypothetical protein